jgi:5-methyltetrahydropteroyltriglutamate--homocysteine methyltransferase
MNRSTDRILTTHSGSLIRTPEIIDGIIVRMLGEPVDEERLKETVAAGIDDVVRRQVEAGVDIPNDGEYARRSFRTYIDERIGGLKRIELKSGERDPNRGNPPDLESRQFPGFCAQYYGSVAYAWMPAEVDSSKIAELRSKRRTTDEVSRLVGPVHYADTEVQRDITNLRAALDGREVADAFITAITATSNSRHHGNVLDFYPSLEAYQFALADVIREEYKAITDAGFVLQLDRPAQDPTYHLESDEEITRALDEAIEVENYALRGIPEDRVRVHWCAGSNNRPHTQDIPMNKLAKSMLKLKAGAYGFEAANPRHEHEWQIWEDIKLPEGKIIIPGLISQSTNVVEHPELIAWRIKNFARLVGRENVIAGVDCGFSQGWDRPRTHAEVQWAKLRSLAEGAAIASRELWRKPANAKGAVS